MYSMQDQVGAEPRVAGTLSYLSFPGTWDRTEIAVHSIPETSDMSTRCCARNLMQLKQGQIHMQQWQGKKGLAHFQLKGTAALTEHLGGRDPPTRTLTATL